MSDKQVNEFIGNRDQHIDTDLKAVNFVGAHDIVICAGKAGSSDPDDFFVIGMTQNFRKQDGRPMPTVGEIGSNATVALFEDSQKSGGFDRMFMLNRNLLYGMYYATYVDGGLSGPADFKKISELDLNTEEFLEPGSNDTKDIVGGDDVILAVGSGPDANIGELEVISLVQEMTLNSTMPTTQYPELGSYAKYVISGKGTKSMAMQRLFSDEGNILKKLYKYPIEELGLDTDKVMWSDLDGRLFTESIYPVLLFMKDEKIQSAVMLEKAKVGSISDGVVQGQEASIESVSLSWGNTVYLPPEVVNLPAAAPGSLKNSKIWLDLDNKAFRVPVDIRLLYLREDLSTPGATEIIATQDLKNVLFSDVRTQITGAGRTTVEGCSMQWEKTITES